MNSIQAAPMTKPYIPTATKTGENQFKIDDPIPMELTGLKLTKISSETLGQGLQLNASIADLPRLTPEQVLKDNLAKADQRDTSAIIRMGGKVVGYMQTNGYATTNNGLRMEGDDNTARIRSLKEHYGDKISIEEFESGKGPTHAETYEAFSGRDYIDQVYSQHQQMQQDILLAKQTSARIQQQQQAQKETWENTPQQTLLTQDGQNIGGWDKDGKISINHNNLLKLSEDAGYDLAQTRDIYRQLRDSGSPEAAAEALQQHFPTSPELKELPEGERLTRREVMHYSQEQIRDGYF